MTILQPYAIMPTGGDQAEYCFQTFNIASGGRAFTVPVPLIDLGDGMALSACLITNPADITSYRVSLELWTLVDYRYGTNLVTLRLSKPDPANWRPFTQFYRGEAEGMDSEQRCEWMRTVGRLMIEDGEFHAWPGE